MGDSLQSVTSPKNGVKRFVTGLLYFHRMDTQNNHKENMEIAFEKAVRELMLSHGDFDFFHRACKFPNQSKRIVATSEMAISMKYIPLFLFLIALIIFGFIIHDELLRTIGLLIGIGVLIGAFGFLKRQSKALQQLATLASYYGKMP